MAMVVKNNMSAVSTLNTLNKNSSALQKSLAKVSSGMKINSAQDDASGYAISEKMRVQIRSLDQANQNTQNASSLMKTAEGAVSSTVEILKSLKEKAINAATDTNTDSDRKTIQKELDQFIDQIDDNALTTFNGKYLVDGSKQQHGGATYTKMTNQSLATGTTGASALTDLKNRNGESLEIEKTDYVTASYVMNGNTYTTKFSVGDNQLNDIFKNLNSVNTAVFGDGNQETAAPTIAGSAASAGTGTGGTTGTGTGGTTGSTAGTVLTTAQVQALGDSDKLAAAQGGENADLAATKADGDATTTAAADLAAAVTTAASALSSALAADTTFSSAFMGAVTYDDENGTSQTIAAGTNAATAASQIVSSVQAAIEGAVSGASAKSDLTDAANTVMDSVKNSLNAQIASSTTFSTQVGNLVDAVLNNAALNNAVAPAGGGTGGGTTGGTTGTDSGNAYVEASSKIGTNSAGDEVLTADGTEGLTISSLSPGVQNMVAGVTISISDSEGNVKKSANAALDDFNTTIYAKNESDRNELTFQVGAAANQSITVGLDDMRAEALGLKSSKGDKVSVATQDNANAAIKVFDNAIQKALDQQTTIGAVEARLEYTSNNLTTSSENVQAAESTIRDADMAKEMTAYTKNNVLLQAAQSMLAQANQSSSQVLSLLQ